jgi:hypothetical protein
MAPERVNIMFKHVKCISVTMMIETVRVRVLEAMQQKHLISPSDPPPSDSSILLKMGKVSGPQESFHVMANTTQKMCRPQPSFAYSDMVSAYAGLVITFIMAIYARLVVK